MMNIFKVIGLGILMNSCGTYYTGDKSDHFDGSKFFNPDKGNHDKSLSDIWSLYKKLKETKWPKKIVVEQKKVENDRVEKGKLITTFINHSTVLIQMDNLNILTDPIWSNRCSPVSFLGPERVVKPGIKFEDLPAVDVIVISHDHFDHMDLPTLKKLVTKYDPVIIAGLGNREHLKATGSEKIIELDWWESEKVLDVEIIFTPAKHWSRRFLWDRNSTLWGSFVFKGSKTVFFAGDSGYSNHFENIGKKYGPIDLSFIPIGAYEPREFMKSAHMNPMESVRVHQDLTSKKSVGIHFGTFKLTTEAYDAPPKDLAIELEKKKIDPSEFVAPYIGESFSTE